MEAEAEAEARRQPGVEREEDGDEENQLLVRPRPTTTTSPPPRRRSSADPWPTIDGPLGLSIEDSVGCARKFYLWGFCLLPLLWAVNCLYFWPVLTTTRRSSGSPHPFDGIRKYVIRSAIGLVLATVLLSSWALTFIIGGERLFGPSWKDLVMYNVAEKYGLTDWS